LDKALIDVLTNIKDSEVDTEAELSRLTGFRTGGRAVTVAPATPAALIEAVRILRKNDVKHFVLGNGTNVMALDEGYDGAVLLTRKALSKVSSEDNTITAGAGASLADICREALSKGLTGLEFAYGIPGSVGGAVYMNAGAYGGEMKDVISSVDYLDDEGRILTAQADSLGLSYRNSMFHERKKLIVISADYRLEYGNTADISAKMDELMQRRVDKQPLDLPSCGSTFKRPEGNYASKLIDDCGLRGYSIGGAQVSDKHCGFIVNKGGATSYDILKLIDYVKDVVRSRTGYELECEIEFLK